MSIMQEVGTVWKGLSQKIRNALRRCTTITNRFCGSAAGR